jgi:hypothetical protein
LARAASAMTGSVVSGKHKPLPDRYQGKCRLSVALH